MSDGAMFLGQEIRVHAPGGAPEVQNGSVRSDGVDLGGLYGNSTQALAAGFKAAFDAGWERVTFEVEDWDGCYDVALTFWREASLAEQGAYQQLLDTFAELRREAEVAKLRELAAKYPSVLGDK